MKNKIKDIYVEARGKDPGLCCSQLRFLFANKSCIKRGRLQKSMKPSCIFLPAGWDVVQLKIRTMTECSCSCATDI